MSFDQNIYPIILNLLRCQTLLTTVAGTRGSKKVVVNKTKNETLPTKEKATTRKAVKGTGTARKTTRAMIQAEATRVEDPSF
jgi:hypothetical protein